jgi:3-hydroxybutyryl-CoA dehydrogenase
MARELTEVGVVGLGTMGAGIVEASTGRAVARGRLDPAERDAVLGRIRVLAR